MFSTELSVFLESRMEVRLRREESFMYSMYIRVYKFSGRSPRGTGNGHVEREDPAYLGISTCGQTWGVYQDSAHLSTQ